MELLLATNEFIVNTVEATVQNTQKNLQEIADAYNRLELGDIDSVAEILTIGKTPDQYLKNKLIEINGTGAQINGLILSRTKLLELIELPEIYVSFIQLLKEKLNEIDDEIQRCKKNTGINVLKFEIIDGKILPTDELKGIQKTAGKYYATNKNQLIVYEKIEAIITLMKELRSINGTTSFGQKHVNIDHFMIIETNTHELIPNHSIILDRIK